MYKTLSASDNIYDQKMAELFPLVKSIALKYADYNNDVDDLVQEGMIGVIKAVDNFTEEKDTKFSTYAVYWIKKYILDYLNRNSTTSHFEYSELDDYTEDEVQEENTISLDFPDNFPELEKKVIVQLYEHEFTLSQVAKNLSITRERARQLKEKALRRLKAFGYTIG